MPGQSRSTTFSIPDTRWLKEPVLVRMMDLLDAAEISFRLVGGCVRDALAGRVIKDVDLATPLEPDAVMARLEGRGVKVVPTGLKHGTVTLVMDGRPFEITTLRRDVETDGRHAVVAFTEDWRADARRRDLTINAMSCDRNGMVHDYFGGHADLLAGRIRFVGDAASRIDEDVLRLLRFFRFYGDFGQPPPDPEALAACRSRAEKLPRLSGERVRQEMLRILALDTVAETIDLMAETGALAPILPELGGTGALRRLIAAHPEADPLARLAVLLRAGSGGAKAIAKRLRMSRAEAGRLLDLERATPAPSELTEDGLRALIYRNGADGARDRLFLAAAEQGMAIGPWLARLRELPSLRFPLRPRDLLELGMSEGPALGTVFRQVEDWWVESGCRLPRATCLDKARDLID